ncbi:MAPEG family protein [Litoreibacter ponti]|uniref:MAPEG family protein n=1 Tax=Litoreibacter ponti TaxID=1510457 RepID=A0A2T6BK90_9RHOB|nr:MAPEG family protein [Litoreibacter ponti]PTX56466.1 MAPEG family protein [Litoreibacter ponti]
MSTELFYLTLVALLAASMWIPFIVGVNLAPNKDFTSFATPPDLTQMQPWVQRANRAHLNLIEQSAPFAVLVLLAAHLGVSTPATALAAACFFWLRVAHAVGMISGWARLPLRPLIFTAGWVCCLVIGWAILSA